MSEDMNAKLWEKFDPLLEYWCARETGGWGWGVRYDDSIAGNLDESTKYAALKGHYSMLLNLALDLIPPAYIKEIRSYQQVKP